MKIIGFAGSNSSQSINKKLVKYTLNEIKNIETEWLDITDFPIPIFGVDLEEKEGIPENIQKFIDKIQEADGIVVSLAEHNGSYSVAAKNLLDWCSRHKGEFFNNIPMLLMGTSTGGYGAKNVLGAAEMRFPKFGAQIVSVYSFPSFEDNFSKEKGITDEDLKKTHEKCVQQLIDAIL
ncbi:NADPH-dependent oxidoreductase [Brumimicrobium glaciale]|uniref:NADPH-dependent oxidoreductase n=1 Tax=Brumimicrobium glaciale TaxID=200475 RepID=A0A4Q4KJ94_9FLAO|nr:NAD(P)H-dependent oxidoreductase [Brumimicrobium glaciale]RYM33312.1 NADPH-dependent oxidoreductase [Brumimicrobium glaciale]